MRRMKIRTLTRGLLVAGLTLSLWAQSMGKLEVEVLRGDNDEPLADVKVQLSDREGGFRSPEVTTDKSGKVVFPALEPGEYVIELRHSKLGGESAVIKIQGDRTTTYRAALDGSEEETYTVKEQRIVDVKDPDAGSVTERTRDFIDLQVADKSLPGVLATVPGLQRNSLGQVHARGEHKSIAFALDGVEIPVPLASTTSQPIELDFMKSIDVRTGSLSGIQGGQTGVVVDAQTLQTDEPSVDLRGKIGNLGQYETLLRASTSNEDKSITAFVGVKAQGTDLQFEAPEARNQTNNNRGQVQNYMVRITGKGETDEVSGTLSLNNNQFQLPQTTANFAAGVRQQQDDTNFLGLLAWKHELEEDLDLKLSLAYLRSNQRVRNNGRFTNFTAVAEDVDEELAEEGFPADPTNPGAPYLPTTNLTITQVQPRAEVIKRFGERHELRAGVSADLITSRQRVNLLDPGGGGGLPGGGPSFNANLSRSGLFGGVYFSHTLPVSEEITLNYGLRADVFDNGIDVKTDQISPLINVAYAINPNNVVRASYTQNFQAPPLELDVSGQTRVLPQRVTAYELSYESQLSETVAGRLALVQKDYRDQIDIGLLVANSNIPLFAPVNFPRARYQGLELSLNTRNPVGWNGFFSGTLSTAEPFAPNPFNGEQPRYNDHDQRVQVAAGVSYRWENGLSAAVDCYYGSGFPQEALSLYNGIGLTPFGYSSERISRFLTNLSINYFPSEKSDGPQLGGGLEILNLFDQRPMINFLSEFSGTRFVPQRRILFNAQLRF